MHLRMRARSDNNLDLEQGAFRTIGHAEQALDCSRSSVYSLARAGKLELVYLDTENRRLPRITTRSIRALLGEYRPRELAERRRRSVFSADHYEDS
jgi:hypothetical protein